MSIEQLRKRATSTALIVAAICAAMLVSPPPASAVARTLEHWYCAEDLKERWRWVEVIRNRTPDGLVDDADVREAGGREFSPLCADLILEQWGEIETARLTGEAPRDNLADYDNIVSWLRMGAGQ